MEPDYATCPECSTRIELTPKKKQLRTHKSNGTRCPGSGKPASNSRRSLRLSRTATIFSGVVAVLASIAGILTWLGISPAKSDRPPVRIASSPRQLVCIPIRKRVPATVIVAVRILTHQADTSRSPQTPRIFPRTSPVRSITFIARIVFRVLSTWPVPGSIHGEPANGNSQFPVICSTGRFIAFASTATNLVPGNPGIDGQHYQVYVNDSLTGQTTLVSSNASDDPADGDSRAPMFNADCSKVVFESGATNLVSEKWNSAYNIYVKNLTDGNVTLASAGSNGKFLNNSSTHAAINSSGTLVAFTSWASDLPDAKAGHPSVYLRDLRNKRTVNISSAYGAYCKGPPG